MTQAPCFCAVCEASRAGRPGFGYWLWMALLLLMIGLLCVFAWELEAWQEQHARIASSVSDQVVAPMNGDGK